MLTPDLFTLKCCYWQTHVTTWALRACCFSFWARICLDGTTGKRMHVWLAQRQPKMCLYRGTVPDLRPLKRALVLHENMPLRLLFEGWRGSSQNLIHSSVVSPLSQTWTTPGGLQALLVTLSTCSVTHLVEMKCLLARLRPSANWHGDG